MAEQAVEADPQLVAFVLPSIPESVPIARFHIRAAIGFHGLGEYAVDAEIITSELLTNAIQHACGDGTEADRRLDSAAWTSQYFLGRPRPACWIGTLQPAHWQLFMFARQ